VPYTDLVIRAAVAGNSPARIWTDDPAAPRTALLWDTAHAYYFAGEPDDPAINEALFFLIRDTIAPRARAGGYNTFKVYYTDPGWLSVIPFLFIEAQVALAARTRLTFTGPRLAEWAVPEGCSIRRIDAALLADSTIANMPQLLEEISLCWTSVERFLGAGFGFAGLHDGALAGWCTGEYAADDQIGIGIEVLEPYQRRGLATALGAGFVAHCAEAGITPHWDSWQRNTASVATGTKIGFQTARHYRVFLGTFSEGTT
jgi:GNAT superfamily N-acetyltransferase